MFDPDDDAPFTDDYLAADNFAEECAGKAEIAALQEAEDRQAIWLCDNGREDEPVDGGMPAFLHKALHLDKP
jgi:hypothetical protein